MSVLAGVVAVLLAVVWIVTVSDLVRRHLGRQRTIAWVLIVLILPFAGAALYWVLRKPEGADRGALERPPAS